MNKLSVCLFALLFCFTINSFGQKIPITSKSKQAIEMYQKGWELDDKLDKDQAEIAFKEALKLDSEFALAYLALGMLRDNYETRKKYLAEAMKHLDKVSEGEKLLILARNGFYGTGKDEDEFQNLEKLVKLYPNDEKANYFFGFVNFHHGRREHQTAIAHLKKAIELNPNFIAAHNEIAYAFMEIEDFKNAEIYIQKYIGLLPNAPNPYDTYAEMLMRAGRFQESITMYDKVLSIKPVYPWAIMGKAANLNFLEKHDEARKLLPQLNLIELSDYEDRHKWRSKIISFTDEGKIDEAISALREQNESALKRNDLQQQYESFQRITRLYFEKGEAKAGLAAYEKFNEFVQTKLTNESTKKSVLNLKIYYQAYEAFLIPNLNLAKQLLADYEKANGATNNEAKYLKARIFLKENNFSNAIEILKQTDLTNPFYQFWLAEAYKLNDDRVLAKQWFAKAAAKNELNNFEFALVRRNSLLSIKNLQNKISVGKAVKVDGIIENSEWVEANKVEILADKDWTIKVYYKQDEKNLYFRFSNLKLSPEKELYPEVLLDSKNNKSKKWDENDWWFHTSYSNCEGKGTFNAYNTCKKGPRTGWNGNNFPVSLNGEVEMYLSKDLLGIKQGDFIGLAFDVTDTDKKWFFFPQNASLEVPEIWATFEI